MVAFDPKLKVPINKMLHTLFRNEIGTSTRTHAPVSHIKFDNGDKKKQIANLLVSSIFAYF